MAIRRIFQRTNIPFSIILMTLGTALLYAVLAMTKSVFLFYALFLILGICNAGTRVQRITYLFNHLPNQVYGRASSIFFLSNILFRIFFIALFTWMISNLAENVVFTFGILSVFLLLSTAVLTKYYASFDKK